MAKSKSPKWAVIVRFPGVAPAPELLLSSKVPKDRFSKDWRYIQGYDDEAKGRTITAEMARLLLPEFQDELTKRICACAQRTWQTIGGDVLDAATGGNESGSIPRAHVIEVVRDADYMLTNGRDDAAYFCEGVLPEKQRNKIMRLAFPFATYGY